MLNGMERVSGRKPMILVERVPLDQQDSTAVGYPFRYSAAVSSISILTRASVVLGLLACASCAGLNRKSEDAPAPKLFYTVTAEMALARHQPRIAALQYAAAAANETDAVLLERAAQVSADCLQPSLTAQVAARWIAVDPHSVAAHRAAARAALALYKIDQAEIEYRFVLQNSTLGEAAEFAALETYLGANDNIFGDRQLADRLAPRYASSAAALRVQGFAALRADDPAAAVRSFSAALALPAAADAANADKKSDNPRNDLKQSLARARVMAGDIDAPLAEAEEHARREDTAVSRLDYALLLMTAQRDAAAVAELETLAKSADYTAVALRLIGLLDYQQGHLEAATERFAQLVKSDKYLDDAFFYLGLIADRSDDPEHALRLYAQVQSGDNVVPALLRAATILQKHGAAAAVDELLDRLVEDEPQRAPEILAARARIYADGGDSNQALAVLVRGGAEYPDNIDLRYAKASLYEEMGRVPDALHELAALVKIRPDDPAALNALGYTLADHSRELGRAHRLIERAYAASPRNAAILDSMGWVLYRQGHPAEAESYLRTAYADDRGGDIAAHLGEVLWRLGRPAEAEHVWIEAGGIDRDNRLLKETRERFHIAPPPAAPAPPAASPRVD
jgi:tetratricopeptide (TPR) repeat protein